jgi:glyoxylase-like metal-dependent hydrolase (beta-lactamase superfamily II)
VRAGTPRTTAAQRHRSHYRAEMRWQVGDVRISKVTEVELHWPFSALLPEVTEEIAERIPWLRPHFVDERGRMILSIHALVIESQGQRILVDTCVGNDKPRPVRPFNQLQTNFLAELDQAGFPRETIDTVVCTHLHVDHVGWNTMLVDGQWVPTFPNARHLFGQTEFDYWKENEDTAVFGEVMADSVLPVHQAGLADLVSSDHRVNDEVRLEPTPGHTPGHHSVVIESQGQLAVITGDMTHSPLQFALPALRCSADTDPVAAVATRKEFLARYGGTPTLVIGTHFAGPTAGHLVADGETWRFDV